MSNAAVDFTDVNEENHWRLVTPGSAGWERSPRPQDARGKYFIISIDAHMSPPPTLMRERIDKRFVDRLPRIENRDGRRWLIQEGAAPAPISEIAVMGEDELRTKAGAYLIHETRTMTDRLADLDRDGVDGELIFPNGAALLMFASSDPEFVMAQCRIWNDWAWETCRDFKARSKPIGALSTADIDLAVAEVKRLAKMGYDVIMLPNKPIFGPPRYGDINYNLPVFDPLWAAIQDANLAIAFHVSTGQDPRTARGNGGAVINYCIHSIAPTLEPVVALCASGVIERFPGLRFATMEAGGGWLPWLLDRMDEGYRAHHMWVHPKLKALPSDYFRLAGAASVGEDRSAMLLCMEYGLENNLMFSNDYPHHEGCWPHSPETIERSFGPLDERARRKVLGLNAARMFKFDVPRDYPGA
ncbi:amidohydrolase family protein [Niveispirillum sp. SYP-B3756]|uniref:amidohydrolase family protein n=1 Tax=Niveispirillum sp. SYP-B3756 TaxID=2662178 RepID=UPI001292B028|nr:amidohydrolase family protein [Niveispirillum sp. SYP-B3756]MQP68296.1 amidohydrolase family protein [Niveispirillum sp. SYP-B3756]